MRDIGITLGEDRPRQGAHQHQDVATASHTVISLEPIPFPMVQALLSRIVPPGTHLARVSGHSLHGA